MPPTEAYSKLPVTRNIDSRCNGGGLTDSAGIGAAAAAAFRADPGERAAVVPRFDEGAGFAAADFATGDPFRFSVHGAGHSSKVPSRRI